LAAIHTRPVVFLSILVLRPELGGRTNFEPFRLAYNGDSDIKIYIDASPRPRTNDFISRSLQGKAAFVHEKCVR